MDYKIVIADNDPVEYKTMQTVINWKRMDCKVMCIAESALDVLQFLEEQDLDILIIDIKIFRDGGIKISRYIQKKKLPVKIILLIPYEDFYYAQSAFRYNIDEYVIKTSRFDELCRAVEHCKSLLFEKEILMTEIYNFNPWKKDEDKKIVNEGLQYIDNHYMEPISIDDISGKLGIESDYFNRIFKEITGETAFHLIKHKRIEKAKIYLRETDFKVSEIWNILGFDSMHQFLYAFKCFTGMSPTHYRKIICKC